MVHLARWANGWEPFDRFLRSLEEYDAGVDYELVVVLKGFPGDVAPPEYQQRLARHGNRSMALGDEGWDIGAYWSAAHAFSYDTFCFLNSFSVIRDKGWLRKLLSHQTADVGVVGASGSWESHRSSVGRMLPAALLPWGRSQGSGKSRRLSLRDRGWVIREYARAAVAIPAFPNPHIRTNAFVMRRDLMLDLRTPNVMSKWEALCFESGRSSLTRQVWGRGLACLVVGRDGRAYEAEAWPQSHTFRSGDQANLLVADNRTRDWEAASGPTRLALTTAAWGVQQG